MNESKISNNTWIMVFTHIIVVLITIIVTLLLSTRNSINQSKMKLVLSETQQPILNNIQNKLSELEANQSKAWLEIDLIERHLAAINQNLTDMGHKTDYGDSN